MDTSLRTWPLEVSEYLHFRRFQFRNPNPSSKIDYIIIAAAYDSPSKSKIDRVYMVANSSYDKEKSANDPTCLKIVEMANKLLPSHSKDSFRQFADLFIMRDNPFQNMGKLQGILINLVPEKSLKNDTEIEGIKSNEDFRDDIAVCVDILSQGDKTIENIKGQIKDLNL